MAVPDVMAEEPEVPSATVVAESESAPKRPAEQDGGARDQARAEVPVVAWEPVSQDQIRRLEARARLRMADPEYQRRIEATDALARSIVEGER